MNNSHSIKFNISQIKDIVKKYLVTKISENKIFTFSGGLGAGKTTVIKELLLQLGVKEPVTSPTFTYVKSYIVNNNSFNHFDLYRLKSIDSFFELGLDEYLYKENNFSLIEWPEIIAPILSSEDLKGKVFEIELQHCIDSACIDSVDIDSSCRVIKFEKK